MIWVALALFVISFLLTVFLTPKPQLENARAQSLEPDNFPRATENAPVPLVLGKVRMRAPNTTWYGDLLTQPIRENIKTGIFSSKTITVGYEYFLGLDLALCMGPDVHLHEIYIDDKLVFEGDVGAVNETEIQINEPTLFGGFKNGGGFVGTLKFYNGAYTQAQNAYMIGLDDLDSDLVSSYPGTAHIVFEACNIGESLRLRKMAFVISRYPDDLSLSNNAKIGVHDANPAQCLYTLLTDNWGGLGIDAGDLDVPSIIAAGETLFTENAGMSINVTAETKGSSLVSEILRQMDGILFHEPETGTVTLDLIRFDYTAASLPVFDEDNIIKVNNFSRTSWDDVVSQVKATFNQREADSEVVAISQDAATISMLGDRIKSSTVAFPFCYDPDLANELASRERSQLSVPLFRVQLQMNREGYALRPGSVFRFSWTDFGIVEIVLRVQRFDLGGLIDGKIIVDCLEDSFAISTVVFASPEDSSWTEPPRDPIDIVTAEVIEMPAFWGRRLEAPVTDGFAGKIAVAVSPQLISNNFTILAGYATTELTIRDPENALYSGSGTLEADYAQDEGVATGQDVLTGFTLEGVAIAFPPTAETALVNIGEAGILYMGGEFMGYETAVDNLDGTTTFSDIYRGVMGTRPFAHTLGDRAYLVTVEMLGDGLQDQLGETDTLYYKLLDGAGPITQPVADVSEQTLVMAALFDRPLRPRDLQLDSDRTSIEVTDFVDQDLTWVASNRQSEFMPFEQDAAETPDETEDYDVEFYVDGVFNATLSDTAVTSPFTVPFNLTAIVEPNCELRVIANRTGGDLRSSASYGWLPLAMNQAGAVIPAASLWDNATEYPDITGANIKACYSLRRRITAYTGPLIRINDSFDDTEQDVGQDSFGRLASFTVTGNAELVTWYDQIGSDDLSVVGTNYPIVTAAGSPNGQAQIDFGTNSDTRIIETATFSDASPNNWAADARPTWFGAVDWIDRAGFLGMWLVPHSEGSNSDPFNRAGINQGPSDDFESRFNGVGGQIWNTTPVNPSAWIIDSNTDTNNVDYYVGSSTSDTTQATSASMSYPNTTVLKFGANGTDTETSDCRWFDWCVMDNDTTTQLRADLIAQMEDDWFV